MRLWYDVWTNFGQMLSFIGQSGHRSLRVPLLSTVSKACDYIGWRITSPRSQESLDLQVHLTTIALPLPSDIDDHYEWHVEGSTTLVYSSALTWEALRPKAEKKQWVDSVWFKGSIPKHSFNMWVANANRMPTRVRLASWEWMCLLLVAYAHWNLRQGTICSSLVNIAWRFDDRACNDWTHLQDSSRTGTSCSLGLDLLQYRAPYSSKDSSPSNHISSLETEEQCVSQEHNHCSFCHFEADIQRCEKHNYSQEEEENEEIQISPC